MDALNRRGRLAFVPARYGEQLAGGAEIVLAQLAHGLAARGWEVEILTTTSIDLYTWQSAFPAGVTREGDVTVRRFEPDTSGGAERGPLEHHILSGERLDIAAQQRWMNAGVRVPELYHYLMDNSGDYRAIVFGPYPFWPAYACSQIAPEKSILWTCLHDEPYAYLELFQAIFTGVAGLLLQTDPEHDLLHRVVSRGVAPHTVVGCGVEIPPGYDVAGFRATYGVDRPFLLYAGRREGAKGWDEFLASYCEMAKGGDLGLDLVTIGAGEVVIPDGMADRIHDLGFLPDQDRDAAFAAASAFVQTSQFEAFSRTVMEAWLAQTPVIANAGSDVVAWHCERSGAGLTYHDVDELEQCLAFIAEAPDTAAALGRLGRDYVLENYQWDGVIDRVEAQLVAWTEAP